MLSLAEIYRQMEQFRTSKGAGRDPYRYPNVKFKSLSIQAAVGVKTVLFKGQSIGSDELYYTDILFTGCVFADANTGRAIDSLMNKYDVNYHKAMVGSNGDSAFFKTLNFNEQKVKLYCSCKDAKFTAAWPLHNAGSWLIQPKKYERVEGSTAPPRNPGSIPIVCKHMHALIQLIKYSSLLK